MTKLSSTGPLEKEFDHLAEVALEKNYHARDISIQLLVLSILGLGAGFWNDPRISSVRLVLFVVTAIWLWRLHVASIKCAEAMGKMEGYGDALVAVGKEFVHEQKK